MSQRVFQVRVWVFFKSYSRFIFYDDLYCLQRCYHSYSHSSSHYISFPKLSTLSAFSISFSLFLSLFHSFAQKNTLEKSAPTTNHLILNEKLNNNKMIIILMPIYKKKVINLFWWRKHNRAINLILPGWYTTGLSLC